MDNKKFSVQDLVAEVAAQASLSKKFTEDFLRELVSVIEEYLEKDGIVKVKGLGTFKLIWNEERKSVNVTTGEEIILPAHYKVSFTAEAGVQQALNPSAAVVTSSPVVESTPVAPVEPVVAPEATVSAAVPPVVPASEATPEVKKELPKPFFIPIPGKEEIVRDSTPVSIPEPVNIPEPVVVPEPVVAPEPVVEPTPVAPVEPVAVPEEPTSVSDSATEEFAMQPVKKSSRAWIWVVVLLLLIALGGAAWYYRALWYPQAEALAKPYIQQYFPGWVEQPVAPADTLSEQIVLEGDSLAWVDDSTALVEEEVLEEQPVEETEEEIRARLLSEYTPAVAQQAPVRESVIVMDGSRLALFADRAYGNRHYWVYIYDANRDVLKSPGALAKGMTLRIPDLDNYYVDPNNQACIDKAYELEETYK